MNTRDVRLYKAARDGDADTALAMLSAGASVRQRDIWDQMTPLQIAAYRGHANCIVLLLANGASSMSRTREGMTPLHFAAAFGHAEACKVLSTYALPLAKDNRGKTTIDWALANGHTLIAEMLTKDQPFHGEVLKAKVLIIVKRYIRALLQQVRDARVAREVEEREAELQELLTARSNRRRSLSKEHMAAQVAKKQAAKDQPANAASTLQQFNDATMHRAMNQTAQEKARAR